MFKSLFAQTGVWKPTARVGPYHPSYEGPVSRRGRETLVKSSLLSPPGLLSFVRAKVLATRSGSCPSFSAEIRKAMMPAQRCARLRV